jgi:hypothetical protein
MLKSFKSRDSILLIKIPLSTITGNAAKLRRFQPSKTQVERFKTRRMVATIHALLRSFHAANFLANSCFLQLGWQLRWIFYKVFTKQL